MEDQAKVKGTGGGGLAVSAGVVTNDAATGRFRANVGLTQMQSAYVSAFLANGGNQRLAAKSAGYSAPDTRGWELSRHPAIIAEIRARQIAAMSGLSVKAMATLGAVMDDEAAPAAARVQAARFALEAAGFGVQAQALALKFAGQGEDKPLSGMTVAELEEFLARQQAVVDGFRSVSAQTMSADSSLLVDSELVA